MTDRMIYHASEPCGADSFPKTKAYTHVSGVVRVALLSFLTFIATPLVGQFIVRQVNLAYLCRRAGVIVQGRVASVRYEPLPGYEHIQTVRVMLKVERMIRGPEVRHYTFRQWVVPVRSGHGKYQSYQAGDDLLLFLPSPSALGLSSPIGHEQGKFHIVRDAQGREYIANEFANGGIFNGVAREARSGGLSLSASQLEIARTERGRVALEPFVSLVKSLAALSRIQ